MLDKTFFEILTNYLRPLLNNIISPNQTRFVLGQWISENIILLNEIVHTLHRKLGKGGLVPIEIDM